MLKDAWRNSGYTQQMHFWAQHSTARVRLFAAGSRPISPHSHQSQSCVVLVSRLPSYGIRKCCSSHWTALMKDLGENLRARAEAQHCRSAERFYTIGRKNENECTVPYDMSAWNVTRQRALAALRTFRPIPQASGALGERLRAHFKWNAVGNMKKYANVLHFGIY